MTPFLALRIHPAMTGPWHRLFLPGLLAGLVLFCSPVPASAQLMSTWGHPVFSVGSTPYYAHDAGQGNYPGGNGFLPGYGYYPGPGPDHYPWLDGPDSPPYPSGRGLFGLRRNSTPRFAPAPAVPPTPPGIAIITIQVPPDAEIWFDDTKTSQSGSIRRFSTPPLPDGVSAYRVRARWLADGKPVAQTRRLDVRPGDRLTVDLTRETLPAPSILPGGAAPGGR